MKVELSGNLTLSNSIFEKDTCAGSGIVLIDGTGEIAVKNCTFTDNVAAQDAGLKIGRTAPDGFTEIQVDSCNKAAGNCGTLNVFIAGSHCSMTAKNCYFLNNEAGESGGAIQFRLDIGASYAEVTHSRFRGNRSPVGGTIATAPFAPGSFSFSPIRLENCMITTSESESAGIALSRTTNFTLLNCTVADNETGGLLLDSSTVRLQNTILYNPGFSEYQAPSGGSAFTSLGGNLIFDNSLDNVLTSQDKQGLDPVFTGIGAHPFQLKANSPAIDAGVDQGVSADDLDLAGNARIQGFQVDMGAYENPFFISAAGEALAGEVAVLPNPAGDFLSIELPENAGGAFEVQVFDALGRLLRSQTLGVGQRLDLQGLVPGMYLLKVITGERFYTGKFVKQ